MEPGTYCGLIMLFSTRDGEPLAMINDGILQHMRVGGGAGLGVRYLSRPDSRTVGMLGSGGMARTYLEAFAAVRDIRSVKVFSPTKANRERYAEEMSANWRSRCSRSTLRRRRWRTWTSSPPARMRWSPR